MIRPKLSPAALCATLVLSATAVLAAGILAAPNGMTLYTYSEDQPGVSSCYDTCAEKWPPFLGTADQQMPAGWTLHQRTDGTMQWSYRGSPTYFYFRDKQTGDMTGDKVGGVWHVIPN